MSAPIGIFDSGVGGLTVARTIMEQLPDESVIYIGDTAHGPYGPLPIAQVREHALAIADDLVARGCKMIVIACNTASAACLRDARERYDVPVVEVIQPAGCAGWCGRGRWVSPVTCCYLPCSWAGCLTPPRIWTYMARRAGR